MVATRNAQAVQQDDLAQPLAAAIWGVGRVLWYQELIDNHGTLVDLGSSGNPAEDAQQIIFELSAQGETEVAWRQGQRHYCRLRPAQNLTRPLPLRLRADGSYLVTGALGALGRLVCRTLIKRGARRLILMGRSRLPERNHWQHLDPSSPKANRWPLSASLRACGAQAILAPVDVSDEASLVTWLADYQAKPCHPFAACSTWPARCATP